MSYKTDLHIHSWHSDGIMSPADLVEKYTEEKYDLIAITDHEVTGGIAEAQEAAKDKNIRIIGGIELATLYKGTELHILGYYIDVENQKLKDKLQALSELRRERNQRLLEVLNRMGFELSEDDLIEREGQSYIGKPNFARALVRKGYIKTASEAFEDGKLLESNEAKAVERVKIPTEEAIDLIREAGGISVLAHPYKIKNIGERGTKEFRENFDIMIRELKKAGLKGLECIYPKHTDEERLFFIDEAAKYHLHITEGSDFHGNK